MRILVLGLGNDLYGDDGVGFHVVRALRAGHEGRTDGGAEGIDFVECPVSGLALLDFVTGYDALIIVDTILRAEPEIGRVHVLDGADLRDCPGPSPHYVSVPQTLALGRSLGLTMPRIVKVVAVEATDPFPLGAGLSAPMARRLPEIVDAADAVLRAVVASGPD